MPEKQEFWVFGYGSLMWRPGFDYAESEPALIRGFHRALCVLSFVHRGTSEQPGIVLGLDRGGSCHGMAFRIEPVRWEETLAYLRAREQVTRVYIEARKPVTLKHSGRVVATTTYLLDRSHRQYAGKLSTDELLRLVRQGSGISGNCADYVFNTIAHLRDMNIRDPKLEELGKRLAGQAAISAE
jgi:cation transport protein ChaC